MALLDDTRKASVREALDSYQVAAAYLFGSQARGRPGPLSDVDLAVWASPDLDARQRFARRLR